MARLTVEFIEKNVTNHRFHQQGSKQKQTEVLFKIPYSFLSQQRVTEAIL
jgi:hypothetical protein